MRITFIAPHLNEAFGQEKAVQDSISLLRGAGHTVRTFEDEALSRLNTLSSPSEVKHGANKILAFLADAETDIAHFVDQFDFRIMRAVSLKYPTLLTAHTVAPTCPASHRLVYRQEVCPEKSGLKCLYHHREYQCLRHFRNDLHRFNAVQNFLFKRWALRGFEGIIAISKYIEDALTHDGFDAKRVFQIYNPVFPKKVEPLPNLPPNLLVTASRLVELKGIEYTLRGLKTVENLDWTFWILGEGPEGEKLRALTKDLNLEQRVHFKGRLSAEETETTLASAKVVLQTNVGPEGFGLSVAEAQALGTPVIAFDIPALNEIVVHGETGFLVPRRNLSELAEGIRVLLNQNSTRTLMGNRARDHMARTFSPENHLKKTIQSYEVCLKGWESLNRNEERTLSISAT